jgi:argininosuccinate lyase
VGGIDGEVLGFTIGKDPALDLMLAEEDCLGTAAHVTMLSRIPVRPRILSATERDRVVGELVAIIRRIRAGRLRIDETDQDVHLALERLLTHRLGDMGRKVHTGRSRNDQIAVDLRLYGKARILDLFEAVHDLISELMAFARRHKSMPMVGRTHMQPAMPSTVGLWSSAHAESLLEDAQLLKGAYVLNDVCPLGSAAGYGVPLPIDRGLTARLLGFRRPHANVLYASNARGKCEAAILSALSQIMLTLSRLSEDLILYTLPEFGYFRLAPEHCTGSSIMPQKRNPDVLELVRARASRVLADAAAAHGVVRGLPSGYSRDLQETKEPFIEGLGTTLAAVRILVRLVGGLRADPAALRRGFGLEVFATHRALEWVARGVPFREAYRRVKGDPAGSNDGKGLAGRIRSERLAAARADFGALRARADEVRDFASRERRKYAACISRLLGVNYPGLERRGGGRRAGSIRRT